MTKVKFIFCKKEENMNFEKALLIPGLFNINIRDSDGPTMFNNCEKFRILNT